MELKNIEFVYIGVAVIIAIVLINVIFFRRKDKFNKGQKAYIPDYMENDSYFKSKLIMFNILKFLVAFFCLLSIFAASVLAARPYETETEEIERGSRDIIICLDVSWSVIELDGKVIENIKDTIRGLDGDRVALDVFNSSTVTLCPLTDDYDYVISILDTLEECIEIENGGDYTVENSFGITDEYELNTFVFSQIAGGTLAGGPNMGSSLVGNGLATSALHFPEINEDVERSRAIILVTDNDVASEGRPLYTLDEAVDLCMAHDIKVFGIGPDGMYKNLAAEMQASVERSGGKFYMENKNGDAKEIVADIQNLSTHVEKEKVTTSEKDTPELMFLVLLVSTGLLMVFTRIAKL